MILRHVRAVCRAGLRIAFGTDVGGFVWTDPIAQEFERMVKFGMKPMDAIRSATSVPAVMLEQQGQDKRVDSEEGVGQQTRGKHAYSNPRPFHRS